MISFIMLQNFLHRFFALFLSYPQLLALAKKVKLLDMTGDMPGVENLATGYFSKLCTSKPVRMLELEQSFGNKVEECLKNTTSRCSLVEKADNSFPPRRELLKRVPVMNRKRREQGWLNGHPNQQDYEIINKYVLSSRNSCFIISRECIQSGLSNTELLNYKSELPLFEKRSWGSCAIVGLSDDMLLSEHGSDIDAHDTVIRMGHLPLTTYKKHVGSRSDIVIFRPGALKRDHKNHRPLDVKAYLCKNPERGRKRERASTVTRKTSFKSMKNSANIYCDRSQGKNDFAHFLLGELYKSMAPNKRPTTGTLYALRLAFSRLCARLDIYGISSGGGGTYFEPEAITKPKHGTELDSWLLHHLMKNYEEELRLCIYR